MSQIAQIPEVAQRLHTMCKKCGVDRYHVVVAHTGPNSAKIECEVCHAKRTFKLESPKAAKSPKASKLAKAKVVQSGKWEDVKPLMNEAKKVRYSMVGNFSKDTTLEHPKFGMGLVVAANSQSIEVVFEDMTRNLVHNRN